MLHIAADTREQRPWHFPEDRATVERRTIGAGDYALIVDGEVDEGFSVERKSLDDFVGTVSSGWDRFKSQLARMANHPVKVIVVEGTDEEVLKHKYNHPCVSPAFVTSRIITLAWMGVHVYMAGTPQRAAQIAWRHLLERNTQLENPFHGMDWTV